MFLLDTNILSEPIRPRPDSLVMQRWKQARVADLHVCVISLMELRFGSARSSKPAALWERIQREVLARCTVLPFTEEHALLAGEMQASLARSGTGIEWRDIMIAAVSLHENLTLVTHNTRHLGRVVGLRLENWFEPPQ